MLSRFAIAVTFVLGLSVQSFGAEVTTQIDRSTATIDIVGEIDRQTPLQVAAAVTKIRGSTTGRIFLRLDSGGGDVESAIATGVLARKHEMFAVIPEGATCASACALAFLGGVSRSLIAGRYGIHRPYAIRYTDSDADAKRSYEAINKLTKDYLEQMNITPRVLEAMNAISPGEIRWLTRAERVELGIQGTDPVWDDRTDSAYAKRLGISKREFYERKQRAERICLSNSRMSMEEKLRCHQDIVEGRRK